jgi:hypothetical protein
LATPGRVSRATELSRGGAQFINDGAFLMGITASSWLTTH